MILEIQLPIAFSILEKVLDCLTEKSFTSQFFEPFPNSALIFNIAWRNYLIITQKKKFMTLTHVK